MKRDEKREECHVLPLVEVVCASFPPLGFAVVDLIKSIRKKGGKRKEKGKGREERGRPPSTLQCTRPF
jgi:hypothetical protein